MNERVKGKKKRKRYLEKNEWKIKKCLKKGEEGKRVAERKTERRK